VSTVEFPSAGTPIAAEHLSGAGDAFADARGRRPCVVLAHGFGGTVDSGLMPYAERFAAAGLDALAFDYRHFGASGGEPRQVLSVRGQLEDYAAAVAFARRQEGVDPERIVLWGTSFSGGHVVEAAVADGRVAAVISQSPAMDGRATMLNVVRYAGAGALSAMTLAGIRDALGALRGRPPLTLPIVAAPGTLAAMSTPDAEPGYRAITGPTWRNEFAARFAVTAALYRPGLKADRLPCPILVQIADRDAVAPPNAAEEAAWLATGRAEVRTYPVGHFDVYRGEPFERCVADQLYFLTRHLSPAASVRDTAAPAPVGA
jgi:uncharacterized protein